MLPLKFVILWLAFSYTDLELLFKCTVWNDFPLGNSGVLDQNFMSPTPALHHSVLIMNNGVFKDGNLSKLSRCAVDKKKTSQDNHMEQVFTDK